MNERVMQFRIGMFVIVAGLVLTMMIVWFGESPALLRDRVYLKVRFVEAPGVRAGVPVRKSGIHIGEVFAAGFDDRPGQPDGVLVTLALERQYPVRAGAVPRISRTLIGDLSIDMVPGAGPGNLAMGSTPAGAPIIDGEVSPDPSKALAAATRAFESAGDTLKSINEAAAGLSRIAKSAEKLDDFLSSVANAGRSVAKAADGIERVIKTNEAELQPAIADLRSVAKKLNDNLDQKTLDSLKTGLDQFAAAASNFRAGIAEIEPVLKDLGAGVNHAPTTDIGQALRRFNVIAADLELLSSKLRDGRGGLNADGTLQKLITQAELHDNLNRMAISANQTLAQLKVVLGALRTFADKVSQDPGAISRGAFQAR